MEHQRNISEEEREEDDEYLKKLVRILNNKEKYGPGNRDDFDYDGITDIPILFREISEEDYCKPIARYCIFSLFNFCTKIIFCCQFVGIK